MLNTHSHVPPRRFCMAQSLCVAHSARPGRECGANEEAWSWLGSKMYPRVSTLTLIHSASPLSVSAVKEMVELCGCVRVCGAGGDRESREFIHLQWFVLCQGIKRKYSQEVYSLPLTRTHTHTHTETHKTNTEAFCVSPSATDLPFVYSALPGYSLWFGFAHVTLASFCSAVLLLKIASACPGSTASLHKL